MYRFSLFNLKVTRLDNRVILLVDLYSAESTSNWLSALFSDPNNFLKTRDFEVKWPWHKLTLCYLFKNLKILDQAGPILDPKRNLVPFPWGPGIQGRVEFNIKPSDLTASRPTTRMYLSANPWSKWKFELHIGYLPVCEDFSSNWGLFFKSWFQNLFHKKGFHQKVIFYHFPVINGIEPI